MNIGDFVDLETYPLDQMGSSPCQELVARCRADLDRDGLFNLKGFARPLALANTLALTLPRFDTESFRHERRHNIYFKRRMEGLAPDHPALREVETSNRTLCGDQIGDTPVMAIYHWQPLRDFIAAVMAKPALYPMDDVMASANVMSYSNGQALNWHFDRSEFTTTLLIQPPSDGGSFEYRRDLRTDTDPNYDGVARLLEGRDPDMVQMAAEPGTLNIFRGKNTAHRVTPSTGADPRVIAVLTYYENPGARFSDEERLGFYGRVS